MNNENNEVETEEVPYEDPTVYDNDNELVALCFDCCSILPESVAEKDKFAMSGGSGVCPYCKGPFRIVPMRAVASLKARRARGEMINPG